MSSSTSSLGEPCFLCLEPSSTRCPHCEVAAACSDLHLRLHRPRDYCMPFKIRQREEVGRYVVATRDLEPLELIMEDSAAVYGPEHDTPPVCLECLNRVDGSYLCPRCDLPLCGEECFRASKHHKAECDVFSSTPTGYKLKIVFGREPASPEHTESYAPEYGCVAPLRLLRLREADPDAWSRVQLLMDHDAERRTEQNYWEMFRRNVVDFLRNKVGLTEYSEDDVFRAIGILRTNAFFVEEDRLKRQNVGGRAIYPTFSFLSHSCVCNGRYSLASGNRVEVRAQVPIRAGEEVTIQYLSFMYGHLRRMRDIRQCWFFRCACARCRDPTELGSNMSAVRCVGDGDCDGDVLPVAGSDFEADDWECTVCHKKQTTQSIRDYIERCQKVLHSVDEGRDVPRYEEILEDFQQRLKPSHYLVLTVKKFLGDLYGLTPGYTYRELSRDRFEKKIRYMRDFLDGVSKVDPGYTKWRGLALHTLNRPLMYKANGTFRSGQIDKDEFVSAINAIIADLKECVRCLECEPVGTRERDVCDVARDDLAKLGDLALFSKFL